MHALSEDIKKFKGKFGKGYEHYRKQRFAKMKELGLIKDDFTIRFGVAERQAGMPVLPASSYT